VLSDDTKRREYEAWGQTAEQMGRNGQSPGAGGFGNFGQQQGGWNFRSNVRPEDLFRDIFGEAFQGRSPFGPGGGDFEDFSESLHGFGAAQEVNLKQFKSKRYFSKCI